MTMAGDRGETSRTLFSAQILVFVVVGLFGNLNILYATYQHERLRTKNGIFLAQLAVLHIIALVFELNNAYYEYFAIPVIRDECFKKMTPLMLVHGWQGSMYFVMAVNFLYSVLKPLKYRFIETYRYCLWLNLPSIAYTLALYTWSYFSMNDDIIPFCNPPLAYPTIISKVNAMSQLLLTLFAFGCFIGAYATVKYKDLVDIGKQCPPCCFQGSPLKKTTCVGCHVRDSNKFARALVLLTVVSGFAWLCLHFMVFSAYFWTDNRLYQGYIQSYAVIFALISYTQDYFIFYCRSELYRSAFQLQINKLLCCEVFDHY
ncbi:unnamed protein product, partial [Mesorhabditis spiculigera]